MRELKFRAWHKELDDMVYSYNNEVIFWHNINMYRDMYSEIMQYTGLKDKNGKEIYEGDIIECGYGKGEVIFNAGCFMVQWIDDKEANMEFVFSRKGTYIRENDEQFEIIGNIHENIDLLN